MRKIIHGLSECLARLQNVFPGQGALADAALGEKVPAKHGLGPGVHQVAGFPAMRQMGRIKPLYRAFSQSEFRAVGHCTGWMAGFE